MPQATMLLPQLSRGKIGKTLCCQWLNSAVYVCKKKIKDRNKYTDLIVGQNQMTKFLKRWTPTEIHWASILLSLIITVFWGTRMYFKTCFVLLLHIYIIKCWWISMIILRKKMDMTYIDILPKFFLFFAGSWWFQRLFGKELEKWTDMNQTKMFLLLLLLNILTLYPLVICLVIS